MSGIGTFTFGQFKNQYCASTDVAPGSEGGPAKR